MKTKLYFATVSSLIFLAASIQAGLPMIVATDNADNAAYAPQPDHNWSPINGGSGYNTWTPLADTAGGGTYMEGVGVNFRQVEGNFSFALYAGGGSYDISRPLTTPIVGVGEFDIITRFDLAGAGPNLVSIRTGNNTSSFGSGELLSFGIVNGNQLSYTDSTGIHVLPSGEARSSVWSWNVDFNTIAGTYSASVTNLGGGFAAFFNGNMDASGASVGSFAVINSSTGGNQSLIFDVPVFSTLPPAVPVKILTPTLSGTNLSLSFTSVLNQSYTIWANTNLMTTNWVTQTNFTGNGGTNRILLPVRSNTQQQFYRVSEP